MFSLVKVLEKVLVVLLAFLVFKMFDKDFIVI